jgi:hypothetical protein
MAKTNEDGKMKVVARLMLLLIFSTSSAGTATVQASVPVTLDQDAPETLASTPVVASTRREERGDPEGVVVPGHATSQPSGLIGLRVRITTTSTVELAGLRLEERTIIGRVLSSDDDTVTTTAVWVNRTLPYPDLIGESSE